MRRQLDVEAKQSKKRHNREVAVHLRDGPLQTLPAARLELDEARERNPDRALHPQVLSQRDLTPAVRKLLRQCESRTDIAMEAELEDVGKPAVQTFCAERRASC